MKTELSICSFIGIIPFSYRSFDPFKDELKMVSKPFNVVIDFLFGRKNNIGIFDEHISFRDRFHGLAYNTDALEHLFESNHDPVINVPVGSNRYFKVEGFIVVIWTVLSQVIWHSTGPKSWSCKTVGKCVFCREDTNILGAVMDDSILGNKRQCICNTFFDIT